MAKSKKPSIKTTDWDWDALRLEFLESKKTVLGFFREKFGQDFRHTGTTRRHTNGWINDRKSYRAKKMEKLEDKQITASLDDLKECKKNYLSEVIRRGKNAHLLGYKELRSNWEIVKTELGEVTRISKEKIEEVENQDEQFYKDFMDEDYPAEIIAGKHSEEAERE